MRVRTYPEGPQPTGQPVALIFKLSERARVVLSLDSTRTRSWHNDGNGFGHQFGHCCQPASDVFSHLDKLLATRGPDRRPTRHRSGDTTWPYWLLDTENLPTMKYTLNVSTFEDPATRPAARTVSIASGSEHGDKKLAILDVTPIILKGRDRHPTGGPSYVHDRQSVCYSRRST
jgi:hypothetical protein